MELAYNILQEKESSTDFTDEHRFLGLSVKICVICGQTIQVNMRVETRGMIPFPAIKCQFPTLIIACPQKLQPLRYVVVLCMYFANQGASPDVKS